MFWTIVGVAVVVALVLGWRYDRKRGRLSVTRRNAEAEQDFAEGQAHARYNDFGPGAAM